MNPLVTAAFFMEGLHDARLDHHVTPNYDVLVEAWGQGCIELVDTLVSHVPLTLKLCETAAQVCDHQYPGVFDYEVSSCFGRWFGEHILHHGNTPSQQVIHDWLVKEITAFFTQGMTASQAEQARLAIEVAFGTIGSIPSPSSTHGVDSK